MQDVINFLKNLEIKEETIVVALSGGVDSMVLLHLIKENLNKKIIIAHINHKVRKESDIEEAYLREFSKHEGFIFECLHIEETIEANFEARARDIRKEFYEELCHKYGSSYIFTGHHLDDLAETILMTLTRSSRLSAYGGFSKISGHKYTYVKPLIETPKEYIYAYAKEHNIKYFEDATNKENTYQRNRFRHNILPLLKKENPRVLEAFLNFSKEIKGASNFINKYVDNILYKALEGNDLNLDNLKEEDTYIIEKVLEAYLDKVCQLANFNKMHIQLLLNLIMKEGSSYVMLPGIIIYKENNYLTLDIKTSNTYNKEISGNFTINEFSLTINEYGDNNNFIKLSYHDIHPPLYIRNIQKEDYIKLKNGKQKVLKALKDSKISKFERDTYPVIVDSYNEVLLIPGIKKSIYDVKDDNYDIIIKCERKNKWKEKEWIKLQHLMWDF